VIDAVRAGKGSLNVIEFVWILFCGAVWCLRSLKVLLFEAN